MKKKLIIIGGGITGCALALFASKKKFQVEIYEKTNSLGGILKDVCFDKELFFQSCQYFDPNDKWYKKLFENNFEFNKFKHEKFSFCKFTKKQILFKDVAGICVNEEIILKDLKYNQKIKNSLKNRIDLYPSHISKKIFKWLDNFNLNLDRQSFISCDGLGIKRIFPQKKLDTLKKNKKKNKDYDNLLGLPNNFLYSEKVLAALPSQGYDSLFNQIINQLKKRDVKIFLNSIVKPEWENDTLRLVHKKKQIQGDYFFWSGNPTGLIKSYGLPLLDSDHINGKNFYFNVRGNIKNNFYIQIYDINFSVTRIFVYKLKKKLRLTVEAATINIKPKEVGEYCQKIFDKYFEKMDLKIEINSNFSKVFKKYVLVTIKDLNLINKFNKKIKNSNLIQGTWLNYSRNEKINFAISNFLKK